MRQLFAAFICGLLLLGAGVVWVSAETAPSGSDTIGINGNICSYSTITAAIAAAQNGDTILIEHGTYSELLGEVNKSLTFLPTLPGTACKAEDKTASSSSVIIDGGGGSDDSFGGLVEITGPVAVTMRSMWLRDATATFGGIIGVSGGAALTLEKVNVSDGTGTKGGLIAVASGAATSELTLDGDTNLYRGVATDGGAIYLDDSKLTVTDANIGTSKLSFNTALADGGGIFAVDSIVNLSGSQAKLRFNSATQSGGGLYARQSVVTIEDGPVAQNRAEDGGGLYLLRTPTSIEGAAITDNEATAEGGAIAARSSSLTFDQIEMRNNQAADGGGLHMLDTLLLGVTLTVTSSQIISNTASGAAAGYGGGFFISNPNGSPLTPITTVMTDVTFIDNYARAQGGGLYLFQNGRSDLTVYNGSFDNNFTDSDDANSGGGAAYIEIGIDVLFDGTTFHNNSGDYGGALYLSGDVDLQNTAFTSNNAVNRGGAIYATGGFLIENGRFEDNATTTASTGRGGAIYAAGQTRLFEVVDSSFVANETTLGGAIYVSSGDLVVRNSADSTTRAADCLTGLGANEYCSEFRDNSASQGGAIFAFAFNLASINMMVSDTLFDGNFATDDGAALRTNGNTSSPITLRITNTLFTTNRHPSYSVVNPTENNVATLTIGRETELNLHSSTMTQNLGAALDVQELTAVIDVDNSIVYGNLTGPSVPIGVPLSADCTIAEPPMPSTQSLGTNIDPQFAQTARGNYRLGVMSPAVDACASGPARDMDGDSRPSGSQFDMGAFERQQVTTAVGMGMVSAETTTGQIVPIVILILSVAYGLAYRQCRSLD